ncbi:MAG: hypothetical protein GOVbin1454_37 [Prokaryotic dsDNA virus sp.]|nr:MAG: hypothetical protein GOVbin1454_37 [Prokaryotic dsDNA virus sp.]|tara:strand:+ start:1317 stop:1787 length:471 start_codon:yes stop_codon:yes gene_type:complete
MGSTERTILSRVKSQLATINGGDTYNYDFSASDAVGIGTMHVGVAPRAPGIYLYILDIQSSRNAGRTLLRNYDREMTIQIDVFVPRTDETSENAILAAADAVSDVMKVLENDPTVNGVARDVEFDVSAFDGEQIQLPGYGVGTIQMHIEYTEVRGA